MTKFTRDMAKRFKEVRGDRTFEQFSKTLGVSEPTLCRTEKGGMPSVGTLLAMARKEKISVNWLMLGIGNRSL